MKRTIAVLGSFLLAVVLAGGCGGGGGSTTTVTITVPTAAFASPLAGATGVDPSSVVQIVFSEPMDTASFGAGAISISPNPGNPSLSWAGGDDILTLTFPTPLAYSTTYTLTLHRASIRDKQGTALNEDRVLSFATGSTASPPTVVFVNPIDGDTGVPRTARMVVAFSQPMDNTSLTAGAFSFTPEAGSATPAWSNDDTVLTLSFSSALPYDTTHTLTFRHGVARAKTGLALGQDWSVHFRTGVPTAPQVVMSIPAGGATQVSVNAAVTFVFNKPMDELSFSSGILAMNPNPGSAVLSWDANHRVLTLSFPGPLAYGTSYSLDLLLSQVKDLEGASPGADYLMSFSTADAPALPSVSFVSPRDGEADVPVAAMMVAAFSQPMDTASFVPGSWDLSPGAGSATAAWSNDDTVLTLSFASAMAYDTTHTLTFRQGVARDRAGLSLDRDWAVVFRTEPPTVPQVILTDPLDGTGGLPVETSLVLAFSEPMDESSFGLGSYEVTPYPGPTAASWSPDHRILTLDFMSVFGYSTSYTLTLHQGGVKDMEGTALGADFTLTFGTAPAPVSPQASFLYPLDGATGVPVGSQLTIAFTQPMVPASFGPWAWRMLPAPATDPVPIWLNNDTIMGLNFPAPLDWSTDYELTLWMDGLQGVNGLGLGQDTVLHFRTESHSVPEVVFSSPAYGAIGVAVGTGLVVAFSEPMNPASLVWSMTPDPGPSAVAWSNGDHVLSITFQDPLRPSTGYTFTLPAGALTDAEGTPLAADYNLTFTTEYAYMVPQVVSSAPADASTGVSSTAGFSRASSYMALGVPPRPAVLLVFNEPMDTATFGSGAWTVSPGAGPAVLNWSTDLSVLAVAFERPLTLGTAYTFTLLGGVAKDRGGTPFDQDPGTPAPDDFRVSFTTRVLEGQTSFVQFIPPEDEPDRTVFPGAANRWDMMRDFSIRNGGADQVSYALRLWVDGVRFDRSPHYFRDLDFEAPVFSGPDGVVAATVANHFGRALTDANYQGPIGGSWSAWLSHISDARLSQILDLTGASGAVTLSWQDQVEAVRVPKSDFPDEPYYYRVVLRNPGDDAILATLFSSASSTQFNAGAPVGRSADLTPWAGQTVVLSIEQRGITAAYSNLGVTEIDDVSVTDGLLTSYVNNGDFETGNLTGWEATAPGEVRNMTTAPLTLSGLAVTRSFYTAPTSHWGRWTDTLRNPTGSPITATVSYITGHRTPYRNIYYPATTAGRSLSVWDAGTGPVWARDFGLVFCSVDPAAIVFDTAPDIGQPNPTAATSISHSWTVEVPAGGVVALVNYLILNGQATGALPGVTIADPAAGIDAEAQRIVDGLTAGPWNPGNEFLTGMTQEQIDNISNRWW